MSTRHSQRARFLRRCHAIGMPTRQAIAAWNGPQRDATRRTWLSQHWRTQLSAQYSRALDDALYSTPLGYADPLNRQHQLT